MSENFVFLKLVNVFDEKVFTKERSQEWKNHMINSYEDIFQGLKVKLGSDANTIGFAINKSLVDEVIIDAIVGMRKITDSKYTSIEDPNAFKIISYLAYWWLRHKPVSVHFKIGFNINDIKISGNFDTPEQKEYERQKLIWQLKHVNELVAVQMVATYIFNFEKILCDDKNCAKIKSKEQENFCFKDFDEMKDVILKKLTYYFSYRALAPKMIEHILEGYTLHPAWGLTGAQWASAKEESKTP